VARPATFLFAVVSGTFVAFGWVADRALDGQMRRAQEETQKTDAETARLTLVDLVLCRGELQGSEKDPRDSPVDVLTAQVPRALFLRAAGAGEASPHQRMLARERRCHHALTNRLEDVGLAQVRDQKPERQGACLWCGLDIGPGAGRRSTSPASCRSLAAIAICMSASSASAQSLKATFTLPYEVHWGKAVLPVGPYSITFDSLSAPAIIRTGTGGGGVLVMPVTTGEALNDQPSGLIVTATENEHIVRYLNLREANMSLGYHLFTKSERNLVGKVVEPEAVAILMARK
jgi:hypothetical protein